MNNLIVSQPSSHAVVIGGSIAVLLAARVLAEHFERVTVIERDYYPENLEPRSGVPQSNQPHFLLTRGKEILEELFPGFVDELAEKRIFAEVIDMTKPSSALFSPNVLLPVLLHRLFNS